MKRFVDWQTSDGKNPRDRRPKLLLIATSCCLFGIVAFARAPAMQLGRDIAEAGAPTRTFAEQTTGRIKLAEGEYAIYEQGNGGAVGPAGEEVYDFHESWTLWRGEKEGYDVEGERRFESPRDVKHANRFQVRLSRDLTPLSMTEFAKLAWRRDSGPTTCEFLRKEIHCLSGAQAPAQALDLRIPMDFPYGLLWPISPFSLSGLTRQAERDLNHPNPIQLLSVEQPSPANPIYPVVRNGQLQYLGDENIDVAAQTWRAHKFSLKLPSYPQFLIWTSTNGILLSVAVEHAHPNWPQEGMKLMRFRKWQDF